MGSQEPIPNPNSRLNSTLIIVTWAAVSTMAVIGDPATMTGTSVDLPSTSGQVNSTTRQVEGGRPILLIGVEWWPSHSTPQAYRRDQCKCLHNPLPMSLLASSHPDRRRGERSGIRLELLLQDLPTLSRNGGGTVPGVAWPKSARTRVLHTNGGSGSRDIQSGSKALHGLWVWVAGPCSSHNPSGGSRVKRRPSMWWIWGGGIASTVDSRQGPAAWGTGWIVCALLLSLPARSGSGPGEGGSATILPPRAPSDDKSDEAGRRDASRRLMRTSRPPTEWLTWVTRSSRLPTERLTWVTRSPRLPTERLTWVTRSSRLPTERLTWVTRSPRSSTDRRTWDSSPRICLENPARYSRKFASMRARTASVSVRSLSPATGLWALLAGGWGWGVLRGLGVRGGTVDIDPPWEDCLGIFR